MRPVAWIVTVLVVLGALAATNPTRDDFARYYADRASAAVVEDLEAEGPWADLLGGAAQSLLQSALSDVVHRRELLVASVYTVPTGGRDPVYLGVAGMFVPLAERP